MAFVETGNARLYWQADGERSLPALMFLNSLGTGTGMWDGVVDELKTEFHIVRADTRGHGRSQVAPGDYSMEMLAADALAVLDAAGLDKAHICGLSMGALVASHMAVRHCSRVNRLVLCNIVTEVNFPDWEQRATLVREFLAERTGDRDLDRDILGHCALRLGRELDEHRATIAVLAAVAPLLGLLGTVLGMIETFDVIALFGTGNSRALASGISVALITTQTGLLVAIPGLLMSNRLGRAAEQLHTGLEETRAALERRLGPKETTA